MLYRFFHNDLTYKEILGVQIYLRASIKIEFMFTDFLTPIDLMNYFATANDLETKKQDAIDRAKRDQYIK
jgi:hypothetical protein